MWRTQEGIRRYRKTIKAQTIKMRGRGLAGYRVGKFGRGGTDDELEKPLNPV